jgi:hypothetical protein
MFPARFHRIRNRFQRTVLACTKIILSSLQSKLTTRLRVTSDTVNNIMLGNNVEVELH